ncbi:MAG: large conductance mechanosensitive channel [Candidatus Latescibacterota bacterium]|jgi:large conductance mechanosensitive channel
MRSFFSEFKNFAIKGNMVDMAIGIIMGTAFNNVVNVIVKKIFMPPLFLLTNQVEFAQQKWILRSANELRDEVSIGYGELIEVLIDFMIIGLTVFAVVKMMNRFQTKAEDPKNKDVVTPKDIELLSNIERLLEEQNELLKKG